MENHHATLLLLLSLVFFTLNSPSLQIGIDPNDLRALASIKSSLTDVPSRHSSHLCFFSTWDFTSSDPCSSFSGVTCSSTGRVTILTLGTGLADSPGIAGSLPPSISDLANLTQLILYPGIVTGAIPTQLGRLVNLRVLSLTNNRLNGNIPATLSLLSNLHTLDLSFNSLSGSIPPPLLRLPLLKVLILSSNSISDVIPSIVTSQLLHLDLGNNNLAGTLPKQLPSSLRYLSLASNNLVGPISVLNDYSLDELVHVDLNTNAFNGSIPATLLRGGSLSSLFLQRNNLSEWIPNQVGPSYGEGSVVDLSHNALSGALPAALAGVESLYLNNNRLTGKGKVPKEYVKSVYVGVTRTLYLQHNYLSDFPEGPPGAALPDTVSLCLSYNCMVPLVGLATCPMNAGTELSRPAVQCSVLITGRVRR